MRPETKNCQNCKQDFTIEIDDFNFYERVKVPPPTFCSKCRMIRRFNFRNERMLYKRKSDFTGEEIFTMFSPESEIKIYEREIWLSDQWDPLEYGQEYDFSKPFFIQFFELLKKVPLKNLNIQNGVSSPYVNNVTDPKNSYLVFNANLPEDCMYSNAVNSCKWCVDTSHVSKCENCYDGFWLTKCSLSSFCSQCENSYNILFCKNCSGCNDCFGCVNLRNKSNCIFNKQYSKEEYSEKIKSFNLGSYANFNRTKREVLAFWVKFPNKYLQGFQNTNVSGNYIDHSKDVKDSFLVRESRNLKYCQYVQELPGSEDCMDYSIWGDNNQLVYESHACGIGTQNIKFCVLCQENVHHLEYSFFCLGGSENLFGCVGLRKKAYCILNKQYSKEEYEVVVEKIKKHMNEMLYIDSKGRVYKYGEFFPIELSPFGYNETLAQEYFPLTKDQAIEQDFRWTEPGERNYKIDFMSNELPDKISEATDDIIGKVIACEHNGNCMQLCTTAFKIIADELSFYKKMNIPLPRLCPNCRTFERLKQRTGIELNKTKCHCAGKNSSNGNYTNGVVHSHGDSPCNIKFKTTYPVNSENIIYCEKCYQQEID